jgi:transposase
MPNTTRIEIAVIGIDIGKNSFHVVGHDKRGSIVLRQKWSRGQIEARLANLPPCLVGMEIPPLLGYDCASRLRRGVNQLWRRAHSLLLHALDGILDRRNGSHGHR